MPALDALTAKTILREDYGSATYTDFLVGFLGDMAENEGQKFGPRERAQVPQILQMWQNWLDAGEAYYVDSRMTDVITAAAESMPAEPILPRDFPSPFGFVLIPGGLSSIDIRGRIVKTNAVSWATFDGSIQVTLLTDKHDLTDSGNLWMTTQGMGTDALPRYTPSHFAELKFNEALPISKGPDVLIPPEYGVSVEYQTNPDGTFNLRMSSSKGYTPEELRDLFSFGTRPDPTFQWLLAMWRLMQQPLTTLHREFPSRQMRRQLERKNAPDKHVTVITLRRLPSEAEEGADIRWTHRWLVRGHWRNQRYKEDGEWVTRAIWIHPHVKGPEGAPFLVREHVYSLSR